ncbi:MAG: DUF669 domain-containing protein [Burkholderiales bacterium]|nr:DUF669 domain-containing protein [Burkholderiales bacterium]
MATLQGFDATAVGPMRSFEPLPIGKYRAMMTDSEMKTTKNGSGQYLNCEFTVIDGAYQGRRVWARLNLVNQHKTAEDIAQRELGAICQAVGVLHPQDSAQLHNIPIELDVGMERNDKGEPQNRIKGYASITGTPPVTLFTQPAANQPAPPPAAAQRSATPPWARK